MKILLNEENEIIGYATEGDLEGSIEIEIPQELLEIYEPRKFVCFNDKISINPNFSNQEYFPEQPQNDATIRSDTELRQTFGSLQMSSVQTVKMVMDLSKQVAALTKQNVELQKQLNDKGVE
ncbi:DUF2977 domain-containing protein [Staphylococcus equorum]|uniref:DUF2977 domain-containing protein n=1 Tax=Staphylococcus equorum TaxID=246432 RepID=UPI0025544116|nr:DUF2977 domain-containing protein [Staphylococcus equorum]MDK9843597.1 DUF2977 domain-containing protein [Staphylococcus equorum]